MKYLLILLATLISIPVVAQQQKTKLVIGIVVDQMRDEYLDRFYNDFGDDGFKRLMNNGYRMKNFHYNYMPTYTGPGHASIYTGTTPAYHGIVGNDWFHKQLGKSVYCTEDEKVFALGEAKESEEGEMSPRSLKSTTITDELKLATNFKGKVIGMSIKDRGAILPAGHFADYAFWLSDNGNFISSSFYNDMLPEWVVKFNNKKLYEKYLLQGWQLLKNPSDYTESLPDENPYEGKLNWEIPPQFPYDFTDYYHKKGAKIIKVTPHGNTILADLAKEAIINEELGKDEVTDFLAVSFSSTDYIGHVCGPRSMELQDMYLRLDQTLAEFLSFLDKKVGKDNYILFLTADHACGENPLHMHDHNYDVQSLNSKEIKKGIESFSTQQFGENLVLSWSNQNLHLDISKINELGLEEEKVVEQFQGYLQLLPYVKLALTQEEIAKCSNNFLIEMMANGYDRNQNGQIIVLYEPGYMQYGKTGTTHGTPYAYDTHVPMLWYGADIPKGINYTQHYITEIAPTISQMLHITIPNASKGEVIEELLNRP